LSAASDRPDRPATAAEAQARFEAYLTQLEAMTPRAGLAAPTGAFIDDLIRRYGRYGEHLFMCFDDPRIPATTNDLERFFGGSKQTLRHALGCGSTTNSVLTNLGDEALAAYQHVRQLGTPSAAEAGACSPADFLRSRSRLARYEAPAIRRRSMVRHLPRRLDELRAAWVGDQTTPEADA
jgi:hypothetical protein